MAPHGVPPALADIGVGQGWHVLIS